MDVAVRARRTGRDLWHAVAGGPDQPPPVLRQLRATAAMPGVLALLVVLGVGGWVLFSPGQVVLLGGMEGAWWPVLLMLSLLLLVLTAYRPLLAWRIGALAVLYELMVAPLAEYGPALLPLLVSPLQLVVLLVVLFVAAAAQTWGVAGWVWLLTVALAGAVPGNGSFVLQDLLIQTADEFLPFWQPAGVSGAWLARAVAVGVVTVVVLAGQLTRVRSRARRRLAVAEEHGLVLAERARIARELHDVIAHHMSLIAVRAETAPYRLRRVPDAARDEFLEISQESRTALTEMRRLLGVLRSDQPAGGEQPAPPTAPQPGLTDLADLVDSARAAGAVVTLEMQGAMTGLPAAVDVSAYRIVQEALTNATRHAVGAPVRIALRRSGGELALSVRNGPGGSGRPGPAGHGVRGMRERVAALGGELHAGPTADGGFEVSATLPLTGVTP
ncbi:MAG: sensor histidine kinase [Natronosporangium sp.]